MSVALDFVDADGHVLEHPTGMVAYAPRAWRERIWHIETEPDGSEWCVVNGRRTRAEGMSMAGVAGMGAEARERARRGEIPYSEVRPAAFHAKPRLEDMDANHMDVSICFPNTLPRFCGQTFMERDDKELSLLCVKAYNDWMIDEWCAGDGYGRLIPLTIIPLWDVDLSVEEIRRCAAKGSHAVAFSENPHPLGLPSVHSGYWDPFFAACQETETVV